MQCIHRAGQPGFKSQFFSAIKINDNYQMKRILQRPGGQHKDKMD